MAPDVRATLRWDSRKLFKLGGIRLNPILYLTCSFIMTCQIYRPIIAGYQIFHYIEPYACTGTCYHYYTGSWQPHGFLLEIRVWLFGFKLSFLHIRFWRKTSYHCRLYYTHFRSYNLCFNYFIVVTLEF